MKLLVLRKTITNLVSIIFLPILLITAIIYRYKKKKLYVFGGYQPILNFKYWSTALKTKLPTVTIVNGVYHINQKSDFDLYFSDFTPKFFRALQLIEKRVSNHIGRYFALIYVLMNAKSIHMSYCGFALYESIIEPLEPILFKLAKINTIILPYGGDCYMYSKIDNLSLRNVLLAKYPYFGKNETLVKNRVRRWQKHADIIMTGAQTEGIGFWSITPFNMLCIDSNNIKYKSNNIRSSSNKKFKIAHSSNHRIIKGTEYLIKAVNSLQIKGYDVSLEIIEGKKNNEVLEILRGSDLLADQFIMGYYGLSAIEGMMLGLPVLCNLENNEYLTLGRRYSFLGECPIISTTPESIEQNIEVLINNPDLREKLGKAGQIFVEKYHSYRTANYIFTSIYDFLDGKNIDLMNIFHPVLSKYNNSSEPVEHPLIDNQIPEKYLTEQAAHSKEEPLLSV